MWPPGAAPATSFWGGPFQASACRQKRGKLWPVCLYMSGGNDIRIIMFLLPIIRSLENISSVRNMNKTSITTMHPPPPSIYGYRADFCAMFRTRFEFLNLECFF